MADNPIPEDVQQFLGKNIRSIAQLEILLLLSASPDRRWTAAEVYRALLSNQHLIEETLDFFSGAGLLSQSADGKSYQFSPSSDAVKNTVSTLSDLYRDRASRVIQAIYETRVSEIEEFAKAFKIRKDK